MNVKRLDKILLSTILLAFSFKVYAAPNLLLNCLAKEEQRLHQNKAHNALFYLNQEFVNELASANDISIKKEYVDLICNSSTYSPSVGLLRLLLIKEHQLYDLNLQGVSQTMRPYKMGHINEFQKQVPRIFIQYLAGLQSELATPHCLKKAIVELETFSEKVKYLEEELPAHQLIAQKTAIESIFKKLQKFSEIKKNCQIAADKKLDALKKKQNAQL